MANNIFNQAIQRKDRERKLLLSKLFVDAEVKTEPEEPSKVVVAGMAEAKTVNNYSETFFGRASEVFRGEISTMFKASLWFLIFTLPFILVYAVASGYFEQYVLGGTYNFMGNIGVGYPGGGDSIAESVANLLWNVKQPVFMMLAGAGIISSFGLAGVFYCAKRSYFQDNYKKITRTYWMGFAKYWWKFALMASVSVLIILAMGTALIYLLKQQTLGSISAGAYCGVIFSFLVGVPLLTIPMVMMGLFTSYELTFKDSFKNALVIIVNCPIAVVIVGIGSALPLCLFAVGKAIGIIVYLVMAAGGFMFMALMWTALVNRGMSICSTLKSSGERKAKTAKKQSDKKAKFEQQQAIYGEANVVKKKKQPQQPYQNPKKKKKKQ